MYYRRAPPIAVPQDRRPLSDEQLEQMRRIRARIRAERLAAKPAPAPAPAERYEIEPTTHAHVRQTVLGWAVGSSAPAEPTEQIVTRAGAFEAFVLGPLRSDAVELAQAATQSAAATRH